MTIDLSGDDCTMAEVFGKGSPSEMTKRFWAHAKKHAKIKKG